MEEQDSSKEFIEKITPQNDWFLQFFVNIVNQNTSSSSIMGVTLVTHGFLVSGELINGIEYFKNFGKAMASGFPAGDANAERISKSIAELGEDVFKNVQSTNDDIPMYIHLKNARIFHNSGNAIPSGDPILWRGRITEISGFSLGTLTSNV